MLKQSGTFTHTPTDGGLAVKLHGDIDHHSAAVLRTELDRFLCAERPSCLWLDLSAVEFMDSSGLGLILGRLNLMQRLGGRMILRDPGERVEKILQLAGLERLIAIERTHDKKSGSQ